MNKRNPFFRYIIGWLLAITMILGHLPGTTSIAKADGWTDWGALFADSGWYDSDAAKETEPAKESKNKNSGKKDKQKKQKKESQKTEAESQKTETESQKTGTQEISIEEDGTYTSRDEVAAYIHEFDHLPDNFITKKEAKDLGWENSKGNLDKVAPGKSIGGDYFGNYEEQLPVKKGRKYYECDIDYTGGYREAKRIIFSNDGLIFYTEDHYTTFEQLY